MLHLVLMGFLQRVVNGGGLADCLRSNVRPESGGTPGLGDRRNGGQDHPHRQGVVLRVARDWLTGIDPLRVKKTVLPSKNLAEVLEKSVF